MDRRVVSAVWALLLFVGTAFGLQDKPQGEGEELTLGADLVVLDVSVTDRANRPVSELPMQRFSVLEDGQPQKIEFFSKALAPISLGLVLDTSGSMRTKMSLVTQAASRLLQASRPDDETAVIEFREDANLIEEFTSNTADVEKAIGDIEAVGQTGMLDALYLASDYVQQEGRNRRKAIVIVTDGLDKNSFYTYKDVVEHLRHLDVRLYLVGFTQDLNESGSVFHKSDRGKAEELLRKLAEDTGGRSYFPKDPAQLATINDEIALDLRTVYSIGYYPTNSKKDGSFRAVQVKVLSPDGAKEDGKLTARTRTGYVAGKP